MHRAREALDGANAQNRCDKGLGRFECFSRSEGWGVGASQTQLRMYEKANCFAN